MAKLSWSMRILPVVLFVGALQALGQVPTVTIGPKPCDAPDINATPGYQFVWATNPSTATLGIIFYKSDYPTSTSPDPLLNMLPSNGGYSTVPSPKTTQTVNPNVFANSVANQLTYKYTQVLNGKACDGRIIIIRPVKK